MRKVAPPIMLTVTRNAPLRPSLSPTTPKISAPSGRNAKAAAKSAKAAISACVGSRPAKKTFEMTDARLPKMKKSYHSKAVPAEEAMMTRAIDQGLWSCRSAMVAIAPPLGARDSSAAVSVQLADRTFDAGERDAEFLGHDMVGERLAVVLEHQLLHDFEIAVHVVAKKFGI